MIMLLERNDAAATFGLAVPVRLLRVEERRDRVVIDLPADLVEQIELKLRQDLHLVRDAGILHVLHRRLYDVARVLRKRSVLRIVDDHGVADHGERLDTAERIDHRRFKIGNVDHVALLDHGIAVVGCIEADAVLHGILVEIRCGDGNMPELTVDVDDLEVHHLYILFLDERHNVFCGSSHV